MQLERHLNHRTLTAHRFQCLSRIDHQIQHHLLQPTGVALHVHRFVRERQEHADAARIERIPLRVHDVPDHAVQIDQFTARHVSLSRKRQQVAHDALGTSRFASDRLQRLAIVLGPRAAQQELREPADRCQRVVQLMCHTSQHVSERRHAFAASQSFVAPMAFRHILGNSFENRRSAVLVLHHA